MSFWDQFWYPYLLVGRTGSEQFKETVRAESRITKEIKADSKIAKEIKVKSTVVP